MKGNQNRLHNQKVMSQMTYAQFEASKMASYRILRQAQDSAFTKLKTSEAELWEAHKAGALDLHTWWSAKEAAMDRWAEERKQAEEEHYARTQELEKAYSEACQGASGWSKPNVGDFYKKQAAQAYQQAQPEPKIVVTKEYFISVLRASESPKKAYGKLALQFHPDCGGNNEHMLLLNLAYEAVK